MYEQGKLLSSANIASTVSSAGLRLDNVTRISVQNIFTGSPVGTLTLECSNDLVDDEASVVNWQTYSGSSTAISASGLTMLELTSVNVKWLRVKYTVTSGTGTLTSNFYSIMDGRE